MIRSEEEARQACAEMIDKLIDDHKKSISQLEIMKEHIEDMSSEQLIEFGLVFACSMAPDMVKRTLAAKATICAVNETIEHIKNRQSDDE